MNNVIHNELVVYTVKNDAPTSLMAIVLVDYIGESGYAPVIAAVSSTAFLFIFAEVMPKNYAINHADGYALEADPKLGVLVRFNFWVDHVNKIIVRKNLGVFGVNVFNGMGCVERV